LANFKLTISDTKGKSVTKELKDSEANVLLGLQIGNETDATIVGFSGKLKITGGSDKSGVPMRADVHGSSRKYVLLSKGVGLQDAVKGERIRKLIRSNTISEEIYQINCKFNGEISVDKTTEEKAPKDKTTEEKAPKDKTTEEKAPKDKTTEEKAPKDKTTEEKAPKDKTGSSPKDKKQKKKE